MRAEWQVVLGLGAFLLPWTVLYGLTADEHGGRVSLAAVVLPLFFLGAYLYREGRRIGPRPEDRPDARPADAAGEVGEFPARSFWPAVMGTSGGLIAFGLAFSPALAIPGALLLLTAAAGYAAEAQRGRHHSRRHQSGRH